MLIVAVGFSAVVGACGAGDSSGAGDQLPTVVVTTSTLGDVVENLAGGQFEVVTIMPAGVDPHDFEASARQAAQFREADAVIANGGGLEESLLDVIEAAEGDGAPTFEALSAIETIGFGDDATHAEEEEDTDDDEEHDDHDGADPHFAQDPARMAVAVQAIGDFLAETISGIDADALRASTADYVQELETLDADIESALSTIVGDERVLVTNHDAFGYFADRYDFEVIGTVIPTGSTADGASAGQLARLAATVRENGVPAIFAENTTSSDLADTLAAEVGQDVVVVELFSDSLGEPGSGAETYAEMMRTNAELIVQALA